MQTIKMKKSAITHYPVSGFLRQSGILILFVGSFIFAQPNLVVNGDFVSGLTPWVFSKQTGTSATGSVISQEFRCTVTDGGTIDWHVQLYQAGIALEYGKAYELTFSARSDQVRKISVGVSMGSGAYQWYDGTGLNLSTTMQEYKVRMVMRYPTDNNARLLFQFGIQDIGVYLDNISLTKVSDVGISVLRPIWNEKFPAGSTQEIRWWTTPNVLSNVKIEYSIDLGTTWILEQASTPNDGSYIWTIPNTISPQYIIRISDAGSASDYCITSSFSVISGGSVSVINDVENADNLDNYCYWWYFLSDIHNGGNSQIINGVRIGTSLDYQPPVPKAPGNTLGTAGHCMNLTFTMGTTKPKNSAGISFPNYVALGTMLSPVNQFSDMSGVIGFQFWARASQQMFMRFAVASGSVNDTAWHRDSVALTDTWTQYLVLVENLKQPSWATQVDIDLSRLRIIECMVSVENNPSLEQASGWYEVDDIKAIGFTPPTNITPSFTSGSNVQVAEDAGPQIFPWASAITAGESGQTLTFNVMNDNTALFSAQPIITSSTGALSFTPASNANGTAHVAVALRDNGSNVFCNKNQSDTSKFSLIITAVNDTPRIISTPPSGGLEDSLYTYTVACTDADNGDTLIYSLDSCPAGMTINSTGVLQWRPVRDQIGSHRIVLKAADRQGASARQAWDLMVTKTRSIILVTPKNGDILPARSAAKAKWTYTGSIDSIKISLTLDTGKTWISLGKTAANKNELTFTVPDTGGSGCRVRATESSDSLVADTSDGWFSIKAVNDTPFILSIPLTKALEDSLYSYTVVCGDSDKGDTLIYKLDTCPAGMTISSTGLLQWKPGRSEVGKHPITLNVTDRQGFPAKQTWIIQVATTRSISLTSPKNGDSWAGKSTVKATWTFTGNIDSIDVALTLDTGKTWIWLGRTAANKNELTLTVPDTSRSGCRVRAIESRDSLVADTGDGWFSIKKTIGTLSGLRIPLKTELSSLRYNRNSNSLCMNIALAEPQRVSARFFSLQGRLQGLLLDQKLPAGLHTINKIGFFAGSQGSGPIIAYIKLGTMRIFKMVLVE